MNLLIRLYPRQWRERYGDEFGEILESRPLGPSEVADVVLGALDARLHSHGRRGVRLAEHTRTPTAPRIGASAAAAGGALWVLTLILAVRPEPPVRDLLMPLITLTLTLFVVALAALSAGQGRAHGLLVWMSLLLPAVGVCLLVCGTIAQLVVGDLPVAGEFTPYAFWIVGTAMALAGSVLFGTVSAAMGALPRETAGLLGIGTLIQTVTIMATDHATDEWLLLLGAIVFGVCWVVAGMTGPHRDWMRQDRAKGGSCSM